MIKKIIVKIFKSNSRVFSLVSVLIFLMSSTLSKLKGDKKRYPKILQLPLTYKCNSHCVMCNVWKEKISNEMTTKNLKQVLSDPIFREIEAVGVNGGEPSLIENLDLYVKEILLLPNIKMITIISNGFDEIMLVYLKKIYTLCKQKNVFFGVVISLDGFGDIHTKIRRTGGAFEKTIKTIDSIMKNEKDFCDNFEVACTVVRQNVDHLSELDAFVEAKGLKIKYRLGIKNKRIGSEKISNQYSLSDAQKQTAMEFFHGKIFKQQLFSERFKYFSIFSFLNARCPERLMGCSWKNRDITLDSLGNIYYCAVESKKLGNLFKGSGEDIFFDKVNLKYREGIVRDECRDCIHDYTGRPELKNAIKFVWFLLKENYYCKIYKIKSFFIW